MKLPNVAEAGRPQQCVRDRVQQHVGIRVPEQTLPVLDRHTSQQQRPSGHQRVHIEPLPDPNRLYHRPLAFKIASAKGQSSGVVSFRLASIAFTICGLIPSRSTALDSSVMACRSRQL